MQMPGLEMYVFETYTIFDKRKGEISNPISHVFYQTYINSNRPRPKQVGVSCYILSG